MWNTKAFENRNLLLYQYGRGRPLVSLLETHLAARDLVNLTETKGKLGKT